MEKYIKKQIKSLFGRVSFKIYWAILKYIVYVLILTFISSLLSRGLACIVGMVAFFFFLFPLINYSQDLIDEEEKKDKRRNN